MQRVSHMRLSAFKAMVMEAMPRLVELDSSATAGIILSSFPQEHAAAIKQLQGSPLLQYKYLKSALQVRSALRPWQSFPVYAPWIVSLCSSPSPLPTLALSS